MSIIPTAVRLSVPLAAAVLFAGCAGGAGSSPMQPYGAGSSAQSNHQVAQSAAESAIDDAKCKSSGGVSVSPCPIVLVVSNPVQTVTASGPSGGTITEKDNCSKKNVATVEGSDGTYSVSAGTKAGSCTATFIDKSGKKLLGKATLPIKNET